MKKNDKKILIGLGILGIGALAYYLMKKSTGQPSPQPSPTPSPTPTPQPQPQLQPQPIISEPITISPIISTPTSSKCVAKCR
ncbi:MAG: hypothetical protein QXW71_00965 [Thermoplasmata archaeon]